MKKYSIDTYIVTGTDAHQSEYTCEYWQTRPFISGFDGSAGIVVLTLDKACFWTDGRYHIQAAKQLDEGYTLYKSGLEGVTEVEEWLGELPENSTIAIDGRTISVSLFKELNKYTAGKNIRFRYDLDLINNIWDKRPPLPCGKIYLHELEFSGVGHNKKLADIRREMNKKGVTEYLVSSLDDIAWIYNMRGCDLEFTPVAYAYAYITMDEEFLFLNIETVEDKLLASLSSSGVILCGYNEILPFITNRKPTGYVLINPERTNILLRERICNTCKVIEAQDITTDLKAVKNSVELKNIEESQLVDGAAVTKFIIWLKENIASLNLYEHEIHEILFSYRKKILHFTGASFETIAAYMENAALMHYNPHKTGGVKIKPHGFLLIDSGAQYKNGTTDITRTIVLGNITDEMKHDFTLVLKSHIALASAKWLSGCTGATLDILARKPMWDLGIDYKSGTGHGLGYFLNVHEGPQRFSYVKPSAVLKPGMLTTNEPGIYREGKWGIRTENTTVVEVDYKNENGRFLKLRTVSYCPIDLDGIIPEMLSQDEKNWLNSYHELVYKKLSPLLESNEKEILKKHTRKI